MYKENGYRENIVEILPNVKNIRKFTFGGRMNRFVPNINFNLWKNEAWLNINHPDIVVNEKEIFDNNKVSIEIGNNKHIYYLTDRGVEYEIILKEKPSSDIIELDLKYSEGLNFYKQFADENRPAEKINSYAVYWNKRDNKYGTGKLCHIDAPKLIDAEGKERFVDQIIDGNKWIIICDFSNLIFPVTIDPTIGTTGIGGTPQGITDLVYASRFQCGESGTCNPGTMYIYGLLVGDTRTRGGIWDDSGSLPNNKISSSEAEITMTSGAGWRTGNITVGAGLTNGTYYWIGMHVSQSQHWYDSIAGQQYLELDYDSGLPDPFGSGSSSSRLYSFYVDYTSGGGGSIVSPYYYMMNGGL